MFPVDLAELISFAGYPGIFAITFAESGTVIGFFLPGASLLFTSGILASQGYLNIWILIPLVATAAVLGDNVGYWFGAKIGVHVFDRPDSRFFKRAHLEKTRRFYARHGARTVLLARFIPIARTFAPMLAGVAGMHYPTFMLYNVIGGTLWAGGIAILGYTLGTAVPDVAENLELLVLGFIVFSFIPLVREFFITRHEFDGIEAVVFDLDGTLAEPFSPVEDSVRDHMVMLTRTMPVAVLSGATFDRIGASFLSRIPVEHYPRLTVLSENGGFAYRWSGDSWDKMFDETLDEAEKETIAAALKEAASRDANFMITPIGEQIVTFGAYVAFTAPGTDAPSDFKRSWDPTALKRRAFVRKLKKLLPGYDIFIAGRTTVDITRKGVNKARGVRWLLQEWKMGPTQVLFVGDSLYLGGNDYPVVETGVDTRQVQSPSETVTLIDKLLAERNSRNSRT